MSAGCWAGCNPNNTMEKRSNEITIVTKLRGFASMCVFLFHLVCVTNGYIPGDWLHRIFDYGKYGVQCFFVISGFVITYSLVKGGYRIGNFFTFFAKRIIRIEPPYLVIVLLTVAFLFVRERSGMVTVKGGLPTLPQVLLHIGYLIPFSNYDWLSIVFWTLAIEFQFYLLFSVIYPAYRSVKPARWLIEAALIALMFVKSGGFIYFRWSPVFLLGINLALYKTRNMELGELLTAGTLISLVILYQYGWVVFLFSVIPAGIIAWEPEFRSRFWEFFGKISYSLYLCHTLIVFAIINIGFRFPVDIPHRIFFVTVAVAVTIGCSYLLYFFVERPCKRMAASIRYRHE